MRSLAAPAHDDVVSSDALTTALRAAFVPGDASVVVDVLAGDVALRVRVAGDRLDVATVALERPETGERGVTARALRELQPDAVLRATDGLQRALASTREPGEALVVVSGDPAARETFLAAFPRA